LNLCSNGYHDDFLSKINLDDVKNMLIVLDDFTTLNGAQVAYIDKVNRKSSAGNPWKKSKKYFLESIAPDHGMLDPVKISNEEINDRIDQIILTYQKGERCNPNFCAHLKDEPVTFKKAKIGKTRVFTGAPFDWCFVVRKYLLSFCRLLQNNRFAFEAAPGTVAQSLEWQEIYHHITKHGEDRIVAGDYKAYDKRMSPKEILAAFDIIIRLCELSGNYTDMDIKVIRGIAEDTAFAIVDYNGDLIQLYGSNPSGNPLTVILNSIVNSLRMRYVYFILNPNHEIGSFTANVALMTYGDDNIMSVNKSIDWFNHTNIANCFEELEIVYTMADKEAESVPFINISDASFLKRSWKFDKDMNCF
jgi:DNA-binding cell septation regulator SpoVG